MMKRILKKSLAAFLAVVMVITGLYVVAPNVQAADAAEILQVKMQTKANADGTIDMRVVSSVDSLNYQNVGFEVYYAGAKDPIVFRTATVLERISATSTVTYDFSPKVISTESEYFVTGTIKGIKSTNTDETFYIRPFLTTLSGVKEYGQSRYFTVDEATDATNINIPVEMKEVSEGAEVSVTLNNGTKNIETATAKVAKYENGFAHLNIPITSVTDKKLLTSATLITVTGGKADGSDAKAVYRNLETTYIGTATTDTSWYDVYAALGDTKFTIATNSDLYGFAKLANQGDANSVKQNFASKTIYLVADIAVNEETFVTDSSDQEQYKQWYSYNDAKERVYTARPKNAWTPIGRGTSFCGIFDAQMHEISGIYCADNGANSGLFAYTSTGAEIHNLKLTNSYISSSSMRTGSIVGRVDAGKFSNVYSEAIVESGNKFLGGFIGMAYLASIQMDNCWFAGTVKSLVTTTKLQGTGGFIGHLEGKCTLVMSNCMNTGIVDASLYVAPTSATNANIVPCVGGFIGYNNGGNVGITNSLNTGDVRMNEAAATGFGFIVGLGSTTSSKDNVYSTTGSWTTEIINKSNERAKVTQISEEDLNGKTLANLNFDTVWTAVPNHIPVLRSLKTAVIDDSWYNEDSDTYVLYDKADLYGLATLSQNYNFAGKTIKLANDIELNTGDIAYWSATNEAQHKWIPIGNLQRPFAGTFDGDFHTIRGLYLNTTTENNGLFAVTSEKSTVKNLEVKDSYFTSTGASLGSVAGQGRGLFDTIVSNATVICSNARVGGLIGTGYGTKLVMQSCQFGGTVTNTGDHRNYRGTGGLLGMLYTDDNVKSVANISNCLNEGTIDATASSQGVPKIGGLVGGAEAGSTLYIRDSLNVGAVHAATDKWDGLIVGCIDSANVKCSTSYAIGVAGTDYIVGYMQGSSTFLIDYILSGTLTKDVSRASTNTASKENSYRKIPIMFVTRDSILGDAAKTKLAGFDFENAWSARTAGTPVLQFSKANESSDVRWYDSTLTNLTEYTLYDEGDLYGLAQLSASNTFANKTIKLGRDIVVNEGNAKTWANNAPSSSWTPIGSNSKPFSGIFDGQNYSISGIYLNATAPRQGLFGTTGAGSIVKNFELKNSYFASNTSALGSIAGQGRGQFLNIYSDAIVTNPNRFLGGLIGQGYGDTSEAKLILKNCWFDGIVTNTANHKNNRGTGGLIGGLYSGTNAKIENCLNEGVINVKAYKFNQGTEAEPNVSPIAGGFVGWIETSSASTPMASVEIRRCLNVGEIQYDEDITGSCGPIVGANFGKALINDCYATIESCADITKSYISSNCITQVSEADIKGDAAQTTMELLDWAKDWECRENDFPSIVFSGVSETETKELQQMLATNALLDVSEIEGSALPTPTSGTKNSQGGYTDGNYYYQAYITHLDKETSQKQNQVQILKYDLTAGETSKWSENLLLNHANDITYNDKLDCLVVCHNAGGANYVSYVDPVNLTLIDADPSTPEIDRVDIKMDIYSIDYNAKRNCYVVGVSGGQKFRVLNAEFETIYEFAVDASVAPEFNEGRTEYTKYVTQGICCDDTYIYCVLSTPNVIAVYDWFGNFVSQIRLNLDENVYECENISVVDSIIYVAVYVESEENTYVYQIGASNMAVATE